MVGLLLGLLLCNLLFASDTAFFQEATQSSRAARVFFSKEQGIPDQKQNKKTKKMTDKESDSLNLHNFLPRQEGFKQHKIVKFRTDNVKTKGVLKPVRSCWVENRNNNGKPFDSHFDKQRSPFSKSEKRKSQFQKNSTNKDIYVQSNKRTGVESNLRTHVQSNSVRAKIVKGVGSNKPRNSSNKLITNRTQRITPRDFDKAKTGVIYLTYTSNNTVCTLVDFKGVTKGWSSCGSLGFKSARKSTAYASQATTERIGLKAKEVGFKWVFLVLKGVGRGKESGVRALRKSGIEILGILEKTGIPHNGCRAPRKRRI